MEKISSFKINHYKLKKGMYISRHDGDIITYDIRMKEPNSGDYLSNGIIHTFEHLFATYARNSKYSDAVIYVGPMGCRTGFYILLRDTVAYKEAIELVRKSLDFISEYSGEIPGAREEECGNYMEHDLEGAKLVAIEMKSVLLDWKEVDLAYER